MTVPDSKEVAVAALYLTADPRPSEPRAKVLGEHEPRNGATFKRSAQEPPAAALQ